MQRAKLKVSLVPLWPRICVFTNIGQKLLVIHARVHEPVILPPVNIMQMDIQMNTGV